MEERIGIKRYQFELHQSDVTNNKNLTYKKEETMAEVKKSRKGRKPVYPEYISLDKLDEIIKSGQDPLAMLSDMKKALMERMLEGEMNHHLTHERGTRSEDGIIVMAMEVKT